MKTLLALMAFACVTASAQVPAAERAADKPAHAASAVGAKHAAVADVQTDRGEDAWQSWGKWATLSVVSLMVLQWLRRRPV